MSAVTLVDDAVMATYALFAAVAMGFLSQIPGPAVRRSVTLLWSVPVACLLVTAGTLLAGNVWAASAGMLVFGFFIAFAGVGGPRLVGLTAGMQLFFILPCFPPYAPDTLDSRLIGVCVGLGLLALAERDDLARPRPRWLRTAAGQRVRRARQQSRGPRGRGSERGCGDLRSRRGVGAGHPAVSPAARRPARVGKPTRPGLQRRGQHVRFALARLREIPSGTPTPIAVAELLAMSARTAEATAVALRGGPPPDNEGSRGRIVHSRAGP